eukprot:CAMPEP_0196598382 /NCGR_PEP_ID=MMETSP1081-20130531/94288_1 /TAXON_ID=36882 /ORGANISM="Pyramimonas amylifera, Strain CCMP720" /LENGTH=147 /DNA_ID=CAMNT_0041924069 /DNA_START=268 /DNA_END=711 /DNA_ORIENTATION=+
MPLLGPMERWGPPTAPRITSDDTAAITRVNPNVDILETEGEIRIKVDLPGLEKENVKVDVSEGTQGLGPVLVVQGDRSKDDAWESPPDASRWHRVERHSQATFQRSLRLPRNADPDKISAKMNLGVLDITVGKRDAPVPSGRVISIE